MMAQAPYQESLHLHDPQSFWTKYVWSQDHKVIAIQYVITAISVGLVALVLSGLMRLQLGFPGSFSFIDPTSYYQYVTMHGMIMIIYLLTALLLGGFGNYLIPLMVGARDMVFPFVNMMSYWVYLLSVLVLMASFFVPGGPTGAGWTLYPPQAILPGTPGSGAGIVLMLVSLHDIHRCVHHGRAELRDDRVAGPHTGDDIDAHALVGLGHFHGHHHGVVGLPRLVRRLRDAAVGPGRGQQLLHARRHFDGTTARLRRRQPRVVSTPLLVFRPSRGLHRRLAGLRHYLGPHQHPCAQEHLRLSRHGVGDRGHRRHQFYRVGAPHVLQRHEPVLGLLLRHHHAHHRHPHRHQGL